MLVWLYRLLRSFRRPVVPDITLEDMVANAESPGTLPPPAEPPAAGAPWLPSPVQHSKSPNRGGLFAAGLPDTLIIHYTAGPSLGSAVDTLTDPERKVSAHLVIDRDGTTVQLVALDRIAWHAGRSRWKDRQGINRYALGIELVNAGELTLEDGDFRAWWGRTVPDNEVFTAPGVNTYWHHYSPAQIDRLSYWCRHLILYYGVRTILGHDAVATPPGRKVDPGAAFPWEFLRGQLLPEFPHLHIQASL